MQKDSLQSLSFVLIFCSLFFLQGCETLKGFSGEDKGVTKVSEGVEKDLNNSWDNIMEVDAYLREKLW